MKVLVIGSTGGSGRAVVARLLAEGHEVTAFSRRGDRLGIDSERLTIDLNSGRAVVDGGLRGVGQSGGRVTGHFTVPKRGGN